MVAASCPFIVVHDPSISSSREFRILQKVMHWGLWMNDLTECKLRLTAGSGGHFLEFAEFVEEDKCRIHNLSPKTSEPYEGIIHLGTRRGLQHFPLLKSILCSAVCLESYGHSLLKNLHWQTLIVCVCINKVTKHTTAEGN